MKKKRYVEIFTSKGGDFCQVNGELVTISYANGVCEVVSVEEDGSLWEHHLPLQRISMVRISKHD
jgi:hypothetical protein